MSLSILKEIQQTKKLKWLFIFFLLFSFMIVSVSETLAASNPVLLFSDLTSGPKTGWQGSTTKGGAVTIWGKNFGSTRGSSYVTVNGAQITDYAEWGAIGPARGLERITFWLNNNCQTGSGTITVTVNGQASNNIPFTVRAGRIFFIAKDGNDANNGQYASPQSGSNGPWLHFWKANGENNPTLQPGDIIYVRAGNYTEGDPINPSSSIYVREFPFGTEAMPYGLIGYPAETPVIGAGGTPYTGIVGYMQDGGTRTPATWWQISKLTFENMGPQFGITGAHNIRLIGCSFKNSLGHDWAGNITSGAANHYNIYGSYFYNSGYDKYKTVIYPSNTISPEFSPPVTTDHWDIGWNEFDRCRGDMGSPSEKGSGLIGFRVGGGLSNYPITNVLIHDNYFHDSPSTTAIYLTDDSGSGAMRESYIYNNIFVRVANQLSSSPTAALVLHTGPVYVYNNIFYDVGSVNGYVGGGPTGVITTPLGISVVHMANNIIYNTDSRIPYFYSSGGTVTSTNDNFYGGDPQSLRTNYTYINRKSFDPLFENPAGYNFYLRSESTMINAGTSALSSVVTTDYNGIARPQGSAYDIGAYEYTGTYTPSPSTPPDTGFPSPTIDNIPPSPPLSLRIVQ